MNYSSIAEKILIPVPNKKRLRMFAFSLVVTAIVVLVKFGLHELRWEPVAFNSLYTAIFTGSFFVLGFILSATMNDYKESERLPSEFSAIIENMYEDAIAIHMNYPEFDLDGFSDQLKRILASMKEDLVSVNRESHNEVHGLSAFFAQMEKQGVPPNFITKLKQEQGQLIRFLFRAYYIQSIQFIPSSMVLAYGILANAVGLLMLTDFERLSSSIWIIGGITFIMVYVIKLIRTIRTPFHRSGATQDDVSMFLIDRAIGHIDKATNRNKISD